MTNQRNIPRPTLDKEAVLTHLDTVQNRPTPVNIWTAIGDIPVLLTEVGRLAALLSRTRWDFADLLAAARATLAAEHDGEPDPLMYLRDAIEEHRPWTASDRGAR